MFKYEYETRYGDYKDFETVKPAALLDVVQDIAIRHSDSCGFGLNKMRDIGYAWLIQGIKLHLEKPVQTLQKITAYTAIKDMHAATSERGCIIKQNGEIVAKTVANWFLFDCNRLRPCRIPTEITEAYTVYDFNDDFFEFKKPELYDADVIYTLRVSNREIDTNKHLNNQKSAEILMDALPFDFFFTDMTVFYKKSAYLGDELELCLKEIENGYYVHLQTKEKETCVAGVFEKSI
jgi:acyl-ACP thioesterase